MNGTSENGMAEPSDPARRTGGPAGRVVGLLAVLGAVPVASAHGGSHGPPIPEWSALATLALGVALVDAGVYAKRSVSPTLALVGVFDGVVFVTVGTVGLVQLSGIEAIAASQPPVESAWYGAPTLGVGLVAVVGSLVVGRMRWPERPRYAALGMALGTWVAYPVFVPGALTNPLGYLLAVATPAVVGYVLWTDARESLARALADRAARWFGVGIGIATALVLAFSMRLVSLVAESGTEGDLTDFVTTTRIAKPLVYWPAVEFHVHEFVGFVPVSGVVSVGLVVVVGLVATLVGLAAAALAARWRASDAERSPALPLALAVAFFAPVLAVVAAVAVGRPAAPLYWVFVDLASPLGALFFAASVALLTGTLVRANEE
ncbi:hypothetical protein NGM10_05940 [Halorussus salilacus]|uniref:hypothetical protein n=1 Tax=Halorussus salilacus TaxID=2953750 RepID=UPI0020A189A2|nr:hypothetical protein [Halorussus salilacus]USZ69275.1 hypothetical protein NGM10_05940 [Halorussus salilacus]